MTAGLQARRARFISDGVATSPQTLLVLLYERLVLDLDRAVEEQRAGRRAPANRHLQHAQQIITELAQALDTEVWPEGRQLAALYTFWLKELVAANVSGDADRTSAVRSLVAPVAATWRSALSSASGAPAATPGLAVSS